MSRRDKKPLEKKTRGPGEDRAKRGRVADGRPGRSGKGTHKFADKPARGEAKPAARSAERAPRSRDFDSYDAFEPRVPRGERSFGDRPRRDDERSERPSFAKPRFGRPFDERNESRDGAPRGRSRFGRDDERGGEARAPRGERSFGDRPRRDDERSERPSFAKPRFGRPFDERNESRDGATRGRSRFARDEERGGDERAQRGFRSREDRPQREERPSRARPSFVKASREPRSDERYGNTPRFGDKLPARGAKAPVRGKPREDREFDEQARKPRPEPTALPTTVQTIVVSADEDGMRVDRFLEAQFPGLSFSHIQRIVRKGELRVNGKRADSKDRLEQGQSVRIPPLKIDQPKAGGELSEAGQKTLAALKEMTLYEDADVLVLNKPAGLAVQGGSGTTRHVDQMLEVLRDSKGQKPRLVHRLDKETAGCLLIAKTRFAATKLTGAFRERSARKIYWALVAGVPKPKQGRISTYLAKEENEEDTIMRVAKHGDEGASHAVTYYALVEASGQKLAWVSLKPVTGRTHQLRAHMAHINHAIIGDPKYFNKENWQLPGGLQNRLHLLARRIVIPHPRGGVIDATAPLPPHMLQSWNLLGLEHDKFDPIENAPEE